MTSNKIKGKPLLIIEKVIKVKRATFDWGFFVCWSWVVSIAGLGGGLYFYVLERNAFISGMFLGGSIVGMIKIAMDSWKAVEKIEELEIVRC